MGIALALLAVVASTTLSPVHPVDTWTKLHRTPNATLFRAPGCYAFQADGTSFSNVVVIRVSG
ncbi:MAG: hypothetical protein H0W87_00860 [Actinobacteria bacterium]|nr:hypothetical protein [Actinomycetota bacterium]